ncbi:transposase [Streptomyces rishiriensis]|uniref:transposase n=1 Tax=Streptomyces rishiriensis TaxID=68264 RepID=UPI0037ABBC32
MKEFIDANAEWLTAFRLPTYAPDLNPTEGVWSLVERDIGNLAAADLGEITRVVKRRLKRSSTGRTWSTAASPVRDWPSAQTKAIASDHAAIRPIGAPLVAVGLLRLYRHREPRTHVRRWSRPHA